MKIGVVVFPGSNCDHDAWYALEHEVGVRTEFLFHKEHDLRGVDAIILPGGFSYGDYLRCGAVARFSPIMQEVVRFAESGGPIIGICNGFQILCEAGLLPGVLMRNASLKFACHDVELRVETASSVFTSQYRKGETVRFPIAHGEGNYRCDEDTLRRLRGEDRVAFRYAGADGGPNGATDAIAGILNERRNVLGLMPHPENAIEAAQGGVDGRRLFESLAKEFMAAA